MRTIALFMFHRLAALGRAFQRDEAGVFAVLFGLMATVLIAFGGASVDFSFLQQRRVAAQAALDGAVLGLQGQIGEASAETLGAKAVEVVRERLGDSAIEVKLVSAAIDQEGGSLRVVARFDAPTIFVTLVGVHRLGADVVSQASQKSTRVEIAMVLDNSGSMKDHKRMAHLKAAAHQATSTFFRDQQPNDKNPRVFVGVVPFTQFVNVGPHNADAPWIDRRGLSSIADDNFRLDENAPLSRFDRIALFDQLENASWGGCVEARPYPYDTNDTMPVTGIPDTLFVPLFAPDEPNTMWEHNDRYYDYNNSYLSDGRAECKPAPQGYRWHDRTLQERMCKYAGGFVDSPSIEAVRGPNGDCPANPVTPLTPRKADVERALSGMKAQGGTNIAQGAVWGLHMLTPSAPLEQAVARTNSVSKVMILMTDGDNFHSATPNMNGATFYTAYGYPHNRRLGKPGDSTETLRGLMDDRLLETCKSARAAGILIFTIGLAVPSTSTEEVLQKCSSGAGYWFLPKDPGELHGIFDQIAEQLDKLRLSE